MNSGLNRRSDNINIGAADVYFIPIDRATGQYLPTEYYLGLTQDGANIKYTINWHELKADQSGETLLDAVMIGEDFVCDVNLLETIKERIAHVVATASYIGDVKNPSAVTFGRRIGLRAAQVCGKVRFHPVSMGKHDKSMDVIVYLAFNQEGLDLAFKKDKEWIIPCKWRALLDDRRPDGDQLFRIGDDTWVFEPDEPDEPSYGDKVPKEFTIAPLLHTTSLGVNVNFTSNAVFEDDYLSGDVTKITIWSSSDPSVATISLVNGIAVAVPVGVGTTIITGICIGYSVNSTLHVTEA